ncbi:putative S-layer protein [Fervidobacterium pennivorans DSM 9078]|uniref:S-layer protein n=1 Tax=Fervidobacterium pennivorans (strain DSM 9078 / Ven5) TaxID=771875 RepID=H9UBK3_FERPD|nr:S-layer homology domain-containing protein [Fervidobacterium pennivorans]AFG34896.1 putative S-layer protein [Fervidobacterium pennivorans DSM 9078]
MTYVFYRLLKYRSVIILFLICFSVFGFSTAIKDLSPSAAEYKAVLFLVEQKIMDVDSNGNFKPSLLVTKLDLARYLYALIDRYKLTNLQSSKSDDLAKLESRITTLEKQVSNIPSAQLQSFSALQSEVTDLKKRLLAIENKVANLETKSTNPSKDQQTIISVQNELSALARRVTAVENKISTLSQSKDFAKDIAQLTAQINSLEERLNEFTQLMNYYINEVEKLKTRATDLEKKVEHTIITTNSLSEKISKLEASSSENIKNLQNTTMASINDLRNQLSGEIEKLKSRLGTIEEVIGKGQDFLQRLEALDALTIINTFSNLEVLSNRFDQLEARFKKLEDSLSQVVLEQRYVLNELVVSQNSVKKFDSLEQKVSQLEASNNANNEDIKKLSAQVESLNSQLMTTRTITYISLLVSIVAGILVLLK